MKKRVFTVLICMIFVIMIFAGCSGSDSNTVSDNHDNHDNHDNNTSDVLSKDVTLVKDGTAVYSIVRPEQGAFSEEVLAVEVLKSIKDNLGVTFKNFGDSNDGTDKFEILIGNTNRPESETALDMMLSKGVGKHTDYIICVIGKKIVINAFTADALKKACDYFCENIATKKTVEGGINYIYSEKGQYTDITINGINIANFKIIRPHLNSSYLTNIETENMMDAVLETSGYVMRLYDDEYMSESEYEIIIGDTNRSYVENITYVDEYRITIKGKRVYLNGGSPHATGMAVSEFGKLLKKGSVTDADSVTGSYKTAVTSYDKRTTYSPTWYDTFDGDVLDTTKWRLMNKGEFGREGQNGKLSLMSDDPEYVYQKDGKFYINAQEKEDAYYGGCILNDNIMVFRYGYVEMSALCPDGPGFWSLIYFYQPDDSNAGPFTGANLGYYRPEIDLNECFGNGRMTYFNCHAHINVKGQLAGKEHISFDNSPYKNDRIYHCPDGKTFSDNFHTYGLIWDETQMTMVADGKVHFKYEFSTEDDIDAFVETYLCMKVAFSVARENNNLDINQVTEEQWENSSTMIVDYVYLYQFDDGIQDIIYLK